jgi:hypothetical protein
MPTSHKAMWSAIVVLFLALTLTAIVTPAASASGFGPCSQDRFDVKPRMGHAKVAQKVQAVIRCATNRWSVPGGTSTALRIADCESSFWPWASNGGRYLGVYQHTASSWPGRVDAYLKHRWFNDAQWERLHNVPSGAFLARAQALLTARWAHRAGWSAWSCA